MRQLCISFFLFCCSFHFFRLLKWETYVAISLLASSLVIYVNIFCLIYFCQVSIKSRQLRGLCRLSSKIIASRNDCANKKMHSFHITSRTKILCFVYAFAVIYSQFFLSDLYFFHLTSLLSKSLFLNFEIYKTLQNLRLLLFQ